MFADRMDKLTAGQIKIEVIAAGQIVPPVEVIEATHMNVIDEFHVVASYHFPDASSKPAAKAPPKQERIQVACGAGYQKCDRARAHTYCSRRQFRARNSVSSARRPTQSPQKS